MLKYLAKDFVIYGLSASLSKLVGFILLPVFTRTFSSEKYGKLDLLTAVISFASIIGMLQLESSLSRYYYTAKDESERRRLISTITWSICFFATVIMIITIALKEQIASNLNLDNSSELIIAALVIPVSCLNSLLVVIIRFQKEPIKYLFFQLTLITTMVVVTLYLIFIEGFLIESVFWGQFSGYLVACVLMIYYLRGYFIFKFDLGILKKNLRFSMPLLPSVAGGWLNSYANRFFMLTFLTVSDIGIYAVALKLASLIKLLGSSFKMAWAPFVWENFEKNEAYKDLFSKVQKYVSAIILLIVCLLSIFAREITLLFATSDYLEASNIFGFIALSFALTLVINQTVNLGPAIVKRTEYNTAIFFISVSVNIMFLFILVPQFGLKGVVISLLISSIVQLVLSWINSERLHYIGFSPLPTLMLSIYTLIIIVLCSSFKIVLITRIILALLTIILLFVIFKEMMALRLTNKRLKDLE